MRAGNRVPTASVRRSFKPNPAETCVDAQMTAPSARIPQRSLGSWIGAEDLSGVRHRNTPRFSGQHVRKFDHVVGRVGPERYASGFPQAGGEAICDGQELDGRWQGLQTFSWLSIPPFPTTPKGSVPVTLRITTRSRRPVPRERSRIPWSAALSITPSMSTSVMSETRSFSSGANARAPSSGLSGLHARLRSHDSLSWLTELRPRGSPGRGAANGRTVTRFADVQNDAAQSQLPPRSTWTEPSASPGGSLGGALE